MISLWIGDEPTAREHANLPVEEAQTDSVKSSANGRLEEIKRLQLSRDLSICIINDTQRYKYII